MKPLLIILFSLYNYSVHSQTYFNKSYDVFSGFADGFVPIVLDSNKFYVGGSGQTGIYRKNVILVTDLNGDTIESIKFGRDSALYNTGYKLLKDETGFVFVGSETYQGLQVPFAARLNNLYDTLWTSKRWSQSEGVFNSVIKKNHRFILAGSKETGLSGNNYIDGFVQCVDSSGNILWQQTYDSSLGEVFYSIDTTIDGGFILAGYQNSPTSSLNIYVVKIDSLGIVSSGWPKVFSSSNSEAGWVKTLSDGNYILYGSWDSGSINESAHIRKLDQNGNTLWFQNFQGPLASQIFNFFTDALELNNGDLVFIGNLFDPQINNPAGWIIKTNSLGIEKWRRTLKLRSNDHYPYGIVLTPDNGFAISGALLADGGGTTQDGWIIKLDSLGCAVSGCTLSVEEEDFISDVIVYPNPSRGKFYLESNNFQNSFYEIHDLNGRLITQSIINSSKTEIELLNHQGVFILSYQNSNGIYRKKIIITE